MGSQILGTLISWHKDRGFGVVATKSYKHRYFLHISQLDESPDFIPAIGIKLLFRPGTPRKVGELSAALDAKVFSPIAEAVAAAVEVL
jgi:hypothetical protein